jgi:capsular polysaccharide biosynthesis protein
MAYGVLRPPDSSAVTLLLLPTSSGSNPGGQALSASTQAVVAESTPVLAQAGAKVTPPVAPTALKQLLTITEPSQQVLSIQVRAPHAAYAQELANAVASSYIKYAGQLRESTTGVSSLQQESTQLTQQVQSLQTQINTVQARIGSEGATSSAGLLDSTLVNSLRTEENQVALQLASVNGQIATAQDTSGSAGNSIQVLQKAAVQPASGTSTLLADGVIGLIIGLLAGCTFVLIRRENDQRLYFRDDIARAAGVPVIASIEAPSCATASDWWTLFEAGPDTSSAWALRRLLYTVLNTGAHKASAVRVISFRNDFSAFATGPLLALHAGLTGTPTALIAGDQHELEPLRACLMESERVSRELPFNIAFDEIDDPPRLRVSLTLVDSDQATVRPCDGVNLFSVSPGFATAEELARLALRASEGGCPLDMIVVVNPDPADQTNGISVDDTLRLLPFHEDANRGSWEGRHARQSRETKDSTEFLVTREQ